MKPINPTLYDGEDEGGPVECAECEKLYAVGATYSCRICGVTVCKWCFGDHIDKHCEGQEMME